ncbi:K02A2.6-like [Cordylochernes scorpioides]|uniref:K02A2.6-like n=1 Tax=Cordylochernes scorpioides TaxID=51811 RepID=A0ABY6LMS7_9ARAC|nr:K02A2.6-like [Cordylochernes scorpioides]
MTYLAKVRKCDLSKLAYELGEVVPPESRIVDLKHLILNSQSYEEEFAKQLLETLIEDRERIEERERIEDRKRIEDRERIERERKEQMVMEFELEKLRIQTTRGNNDTSRSTSNDAHYEIRKLMPKYESKDNDLSFYLILFERQAKRLGLDEDQWAFSLLGLLPYEMTQLIARETEEQSGDYRFVKRLLLKRYKLSPEQFRQKFEKHERSQKGSWRDFAFELRGYFNEWIEGMNVENFDALKDLSVTNQLKKKVPNVLRNHLIDDWTKLNNPDELADKLDEYENVRTEMGPPHWNAKHLIPPSFQQKSARFPNQSEVKEAEQGTNVSGQDAARNEISETYPNTLRRMVNRTIRNDKGEPKCFNCNQFGHIARDCPAPRTTLTCRGCGQTGHKERNCTRPKEGLKVANLEVEGLETVPPDVYLKDVKIDNKETVKAMIDTGSSSCLMRESVARRISVDIEPDSTSLYGIGNQTAPAARTVGKTTVDLEIDGIVGREITVFIVNDDAQPYDLLIGRTWTDLPYVSFARIGKNLHIGYSSEFPFANLQEEIKSRRIELRATETVQLESDSINFTSAITDEVKDGYVLFTGVDDACVDSLLEVVDGKTTVPIISAGKGKLRVRKNQCVGRVELLNLDDIVVNLDVAEDSFQTKNEEKREGQDQMKHNSYTLQHGAADKSIELKQINSTVSRMEGIKPPAEFVPYSNEKKWETWRESFEIFAIAVNLESMPLVRQRAILKHIAAMISESTCSQVASLNEQKMIEKIEKRNWVKDTIRMENAEAGPRVINPRRERIIELFCRTKRIRNLLAESEAEESCDQINLNEVAVKTVRSDKWSATIIINGKKTTVHLDTGAQINVLPHKVINQWPSRPEIRPTSLKAFAYGNTELPIVGKCNVLCQYGEKKGMFEFIVADVEAQTLITGDTCEKLEILRRINHINTDEMKLCSETQKILEQYHEVFQGVGLSTRNDGEFDHIKECVRNAPSLAHFDKSKMLILQCDASKDAMGAALLQEDRPLAFASASFSDSQKQYSQIEKELLSVYYGCKKFEYLLSGHTFVVQTDHQPLLPLVKKPLSDISPRLQRLVMKLIAFDFKLQYKPGKYLIVADTLSRDTHPMDELPTPFLEDKRMVKMVRVNISDEKLVAMQKDTREDPALVKPLKPFPVPDYPWQTVSLDIFYIQKKPHLLVVDRYSGYQEVFALDPPTAINVKNKVRETFARFGIPETMMSDNGPPFRSEIMTDFCIRWGIKQLFSSPHLHRSNGLAERNIQTIKNQLIKCRDEGSDPYLAILAYRNTPKNDLPSPAQLCLSRSLRCQIPRITQLYRPYQTNWRSIENAKRKRQSSMKEQYDRNSKSYPKVNVGEDAWCQIHPRETWTPVKISAQADSPQSFEVVTPSGNRLIRNQQFIRPRDGGYEKSQLSSEPITASPEAQHPQCDSPTMGESSTAPIQRSSEETNFDQREGATTFAGISPEPSGGPRFSRFGREPRHPALGFNSIDHCNKEEYNYFCTAWESTGKDEKTIENLISRLTTEEIRRNRQSQPEDRVAMNATKQKNNSKPAAKVNKEQCRICKKFNHKEKDCYFRNKEKQTPIAFIAEQREEYDKRSSVTFIVDSGSTCHMINEEKLLDHQKKCDVNINVAKKEEGMRAKTSGQFKGRQCNLNEVIFVPELSKNLLSVSSIVNNGGEVNFKGDKVTILKDRKKVLEGDQLENGLYAVNIEQHFSKQNDSNLTLPSENQTQEWHRKLGHIGMQNLRKLESLVDGMELNKLEKQENDLCEICIMAKQTRKSFGNERYRATRPLEIGHTDLCGPIEPLTQNNKKYIMTFLDDYTHFCYVYLLSNKYEAK